MQRESTHICDMTIDDPDRQHSYEAYCVAVGEYVRVPVCPCHDTRHGERAVSSVRPSTW